MGRFDYMPEADYNTWQAEKFTREAQSRVFPYLAQKKIEASQPPPQEPDGFEPPPELGLSPSHPGTALGLNPQQYADLERAKAEMDQRQQSPYDFPVSGPRYGESALGERGTREDIGSAFQGFQQFNRDEAERLNRMILSENPLEVGLAGLETFPGTQAVTGISKAGLKLGAMSAKEAGETGARIAGEVADVGKLRLGQLATEETGAIRFGKGKQSGLTYDDLQKLIDEKEDQLLQGDESYAKWQSIQNDSELEALYQRRDAVGAQEIQALRENVFKALPGEIDPKDANYLLESVYRVYPADNPAAMYMGAQYAKDAFTQAGAADAKEKITRHLLDQWATRNNYDLEGVFGPKSGLSRAELEGVKTEIKTAADDFHQAVLDAMANTTPGRENTASVLQIESPKLRIGAQQPPGQLATEETGAIGPGVSRLAGTPKATQDILHTDVDKLVSKFPDQEVQTTLRDIIDSNPQRFEDARRGVIPDDVVDDMASKLGLTPDTIIAKWNPGNAENAEVIRGMGAALDIRTKDVLRLRDEVADALRTGSDPVAKKAQLQLAIAEQGALQEAFTGVRAETGRALRQFRSEVNDAIASGSLGNMRQLLDKTSGKWTDEMFDQFLEIDPENVSQVYAFIRNAQKPDWWQYPLAVRYSSMLSSPATHVVNFVSNSLTTALSPLEAVGTAVAELRAPLAGRGRERFFGEAPAMIVGMLRGIPQGLAAAGQALKTGQRVGGKLELRGMEVFNAGTPRGFIEGPRKIPLPLGTGPAGAASGAVAGAQAPADNWDERIRNMGLGAIAGAAFGTAKPKWMAAAINAPTRSLTAADALWRQINFSSAMYAEAYRIAAKAGTSLDQMPARVAELIANPTKQMVDDATKMGAYRVFQQEPGALTKWLLQGRQRWPALQIILPFVQTPVNLVKYGAERTPLGIAKAMRANNPGEVSDVLGRVLLGSGIMAAAAMYAIDGKITGRAPAPGTQEREAWDAEGKIEYALKIGDTWQSYRRLEPFNLPLTFAAQAVETFRTRGEVPTEESIANVTKTLADNLVGQTYLSGLFDVVQIIENPGRGAIEWASRNAASFAPFASAARTVGRMQDPTLRESKGFEALASSIGVTKELLPRVTPWGEEEKYQGSPLLPYRASQAKDDAGLRELGRLGELPGDVGTKIFGVNISRDLELRYQKDSGRIMDAARNGITGHESFLQADDQAKGKMAQRMKDLSREYVRSYLGADVYAEAIRNAKPDDRPKLEEAARSQKNMAKATPSPEQLTAIGQAIATRVVAERVYETIPRYHPELGLSDTQLQQITETIDRMKKNEARMPAQYKQYAQHYAYLMEQNAGTDETILGYAYAFMRSPGKYENPVRKQFRERFLGGIDIEPSY